MRRSLLLGLCLGAPLAAQAPLPKRQIVEDMRLDGATEDFPDIASVMVGSRGQMVVAVNNDQQLRFYDASGKKLATFGRKGSGPGEFQRMTQRGWIGDTLWQYDVSLRRVSFVSPSASLLRSDVLASNLSAITTTRGGSIAAGSINLFVPTAVAGKRYLGTAIIATGRGADPENSSALRIMSVPMGDSAGTGTRTLIALGPPTAHTRVDYRADNGNSYSNLIPFTFPPAVVFAPDGSRFANITTEVGEKSGTFTVVMFSSQGDTIFRRAYPFVGTPIPPSVADSALNAIGVSSDGKPFFPPDVSVRLREAIRPKMPKVYSPVSSMILGLDGTAWVSGRVTPSGRAVIAIDARGNQIFTLDLPPRTRLVQANLTTLWAIQTDEDDLPSVVRYKVR